MAAFVLGNGRSRSSIDVNHLMKLGPVYGCNALYRTHTPNVLVSTDRGIAEEIQKSGYSTAHRFHTRRPIDGLGALPVPKQYFGFSSGPIAMSLAALDHHDPIYLLGFDMGPSESGKVNNIYVDTEFYKASTGSPTYNGNWIRQISRVARDHPNQKFIRIYAPLVAEIPDFGAVPNIERMEISAFVRLINTSKDL